MGPGETVGLWGHSGCGKSSIVRALTGLLNSEPGWVEGTAKYQGKSVSPRPRQYIEFTQNGSEPGTSARVVRIVKDSIGFQEQHRRLLRPYLGSEWRMVWQEPIYSFESTVSIGKQCDSFFRRLRRLGVGTE